MQKWYEIIFEGKGYVGLKVCKDDVIRITNILSEIGIDVPLEGLHVTLIYDKTNPDINYKPDIKKYVAYPIDIHVMGKPSSDFYSIALILVSDELISKFNSLKETGFKHSYSEFVPHVSLIYKPTEDQINTILTNKDYIIHSLKSISFDSEWNEELHS